MYWVDQRATEIVGAFNADDEMDSTEVQRVWELATSSGWVRQATMKRFLSNERYAEYFLAQQESLLQAAVGLDAELAGGIASSVLEGSCYERSPENSSIIRACLSLALYSDQDASRTAIFAVSTMGKTTDPDALGSLGQGLGTLGERLDPAVARQGAEAIVAAMGKTTDLDALVTLGQGLGALGERLDPAGARQVAEAIVAAMGKTTDPYALATLGQGLGALGEHLNPAGARQGVEAIVAAMGKTTNPDALWTLGQGLGALGERLDPRMGTSVARQGVEAIVAAMGKTTNPYALRTLGQGLGALGERLDPAGARQVTEVIIATIKASALPPCSALAGLARDDELPLIVDMLKWPTCSPGDRNVLMEHVAKLQGVDPTFFGQYVEVEDERRFRADLWRFVEWAENQRYPDGRSFDLTTPPEMPNFNRTPAN